MSGISCSYDVRFNLSIVKDSSNCVILADEFYPGSLLNVNVCGSCLCFSKALIVGLGGSFVSILSDSMLLAMEGRQPVGGRKDPTSREPMG